MRTSSAFKRLMISTAVPAGASMQVHDTASKLGRPASTNVGTSGTGKARLSPVTPRARSLPLFTKGTAASMVPNITCTCPAVSSVSAGAAPLYGMCSMLVRVSDLNNSPARCPVPARPELAYDNCPGRERASAINSFTLRAGSAGCTISISGCIVSRAMGA